MLRWLFGSSEPPLRGGRILLVEPHRRHYEAWALLREASRHHLVPFEPAWAEDELSPASFRRRLRRHRHDRRQGSGAAYFIERTADRALLGGVTLTGIRRGVTQSASVGYWIGLPFVRQGYASEAVATVLDHAFLGLGLNRVEAACLPRNRASIGVLEGAGFRREGLARRYLCINGNFEDHILFGRLCDDTAAARDATRAGADAVTLRRGSARPEGRAA